MQHYSLRARNGNGYGGATGFTHKGGVVPVQSKDPAAYYVEICCECPKKALYRVGRTGYCKDHRQLAIDRRKRIQTELYEPARAEREHAHNEWEKVDMKRRRAAANKIRR